MKHIFLFPAGLLALKANVVAQSDSDAMPACSFGLLAQYRRQHDPLLNQRKVLSEAIFQQQLIKQRRLQYAAGGQLQLTGN